MRISVIGGGYGGLASAARLAKLGHEVTLVEAGPALGGVLRGVHHEGVLWPSPVSGMALPAVVRDLFRKSGRPIEREVELTPREVVRQHRFENRTDLFVHGGTRGAQLEALGPEWVAFVESYGAEWEVLRTQYLEVPWDRAHLSKDLKRILTSRETLEKRAKRAFKDKRLQMMAMWPAIAGGHAPRATPGWVGVSAYLEQRFGVFDIVGGPTALADALAARMETRGVRLLLNTPALDVVIRDGRAVAVSTDEGDLDADAVVVAIDPGRLPALERLSTQTLPVMPPAITWLELDAPLDLAPEVAVHGAPAYTLRHAGTRAVLQMHGAPAEDPLRNLARFGIDLRDRVVHRFDQSPPDLAMRWRGSMPLGVQWAGWRTTFDRPGPRTSINGVYAAGAHATPGSGLPFVGLSAALVAQEIGEA